MYIFLSGNKYEILKRPKKVEAFFMLRFPIQSPTISYENRPLLHLSHWVTKPAKMCVHLSSGYSSALQATSYK